MPNVVTSLKPIALQTETSRLLCGRFLNCRLALPMSSENLHEPLDLLSDETKNLHRAIVSLMEELEAIDWYTQRAEACSDDELKSVLTHNKNEEVEHAMMTLEWIRRHHPVFATSMGGGSSAGGAIEAPSSLGIGSLKGAS
jgi:hypothetical protein